MAIVDRLTLKVIRDLQPGQVKFDRDLPGFGVRMQRRFKTYFVKYRTKAGKQRWHTIARHPIYTPDQARKAALTILAQVAAGSDPSQALKVARQTEREAQTIAEAGDDFLDTHTPKLKPSSAVEYRRLFDQRIKPTIGKLNVKDVTRGDVASWHAKMTDAKRQANFALSILSKFMSWAEDNKLRPTNSNPCTRITRFPEQQRERFLTPDEFQRLGTALSAAEVAGKMNPYAIACIRLLVLTGCRFGEVLSLKWDYVDFANSRILLPDSKTGKKVVILNPPALDVLNSIPRQTNSPYVLPARDPGKHMEGIRKPWDTIRETADLKDVRLHDLRHSFASVGAASGVSLHMLGALLGHSNASTTKRYAHLADDTLSGVTEQIGGEIARAMKAKA